MTTVKIIVFCFIMLQLLINFPKRFTYQSYYTMLKQVLKAVKILYACGIILLCFALINAIVECIEK